VTLITKDEKVQKAQSPETNFNPDKKKQDVERDAHQGRKRRKDSVQERHHRYAYATKKNGIAPLTLQQTRNQKNLNSAEKEITALF